MRAVVIDKYGPPEVLRVQERPDPPKPAPGEVRVAVRAVGIGHADTLVRLGLYPDAPKPPCVCGWEVAGIVESVGDGVESPKPGDRVAAVTRFGGYAEIVTVPVAQTFALPERITFEQGASFPVSYITAYAALVMMAGLKRGENVLIHAAGGGTGTAATQIARAIGAEQIFGTASASKHAAIRAQGVDHPIDYRTTDFEHEVRRILGDRGLDVVIDAIGPTSFRKDYRLLRPGGRLVMYGRSETQGGDAGGLLGTVVALARMPFVHLPWWKSLFIFNENKGVFGLNVLRWWDKEGPECFERLAPPLVAMLASGELEPLVDESFPFTRAAEAHRFVAQRRNIGNVVLVP